MQRTILIKSAKWIAAVIVLAAIAAAAVAHDRWWPRVAALMGNGEQQSEDPHADDHKEHDHGSHAGHDDADSLELSDEARKNIGLVTGVVEPKTHVKTASVPAMVVERPGRSLGEIAAPMTGVVTRVYRNEGEAVEPGEPLFDLRLTHEDLVTAQRDFLRLAEQLDVVEREIKRLESVGEGVIAGRRVLEQKYEQQKLKAALHAGRQGLILHGLSEKQIDEILASRRLLQSLTIVAPPFDDEIEHHDGPQDLYHIQNVHVRRGQHVSDGGKLATLADHCLLYVEGQAFEDDARRLVEAAKNETLLEVAPLADNRAAAEAEQLKVLYVADRVDPQSRALRFYLSLPNEMIRDEQRNGRRFVAWKYRPGQRMEVKLPLGDAWENQIVLPPAAVVDEGADSYVFEQNGSHFDRKPVHVLYRDKDAVVIKNDGRLIGSTLALSGAHRMHLALKNKAGGGIDPHAGHSH